MTSNANFPPSEGQQQLPHLRNLHQAFTHIQTQCSTFLHNISQNLNPLFNDPSSSLQTHVKQAFFSVSQPPRKPLWAKVGDVGKTQMANVGRPLSAEAIEERLAGVAVYALSNSNEEFVLVSGVSTGKSLGLLFCREEDAQTLLKQMKSMDPVMRKEGSKVVALALNKVFQLKVDGVAFRLIPESTQISNALRERKKAGISDDNFPGVPVFQSRSLILRSQNKSYRPAFFRREDLEKSLQRASRQQNQVNPVLRQGDIQVGVFEEIIKGMKESSTSKWDDIVFIPPGFEVSADPSQQ